MAHVHEDDRLIRKKFQYLHGKRRIRIRLAGVYHRLFGSVPVIRIVAEGGADALRTVMAAHLIMAFYPDKVVLIFLDDLFQRFIMADLGL